LEQYKVNLATKKRSLKSGQSQKSKKSKINPDSNNPQSNNPQSNNPESSNVKESITNQESKIKEKSEKINMNLPDLNDLSELPLSMQQKSDVAKSLFSKKDKDGKLIEEEGNWLVKGTFNRFAASF
jgi:hypothetical protein